MSLIVCTESECIDKILTDYQEHVFSKEDYYIWANQKYQALTKFLKNPKNSQVVTSVLNFITYLDSFSIADKGLKKEVEWDIFSEWDRANFKKSLIEEFDPSGKEKKRILEQLKSTERELDVINLI